MDDLRRRETAAPREDLPGLVVEDEEGRSARDGEAAPAPLKTMPVGPPATPTVSATFAPVLV